MKKASRLVVFAILLALISATMTSCKTTPGNESSSGTTSNTDKGKLFGNLPDANYDGEEITFLVEGDYMDIYRSEEIMANEVSASVISTAVANRNALVEDKFNVKIKEVRTTTAAEMTALIRNSQLSNSDDYDIVMPYIPQAATLSLEGCFYLLNDNTNLHLDEDYWDQGAIDGLSISNKNYFITGDLSILSLACTHAIVFNKDVVKDNNLENPYDLVTDGKWTIDKLKEMARKVTSDSDGITGMSAADTYGYLINSNFVTSMFIGAGERLTNKDSNDLPSITVSSTKGLDVFEKIFALVNDKQATGQIETLKEITPSSKSVWRLATESVANKKVLFRAMAIVDMPELGEYECNFGILPVPKYDDTQDNYYSIVSTVYASSAAIPVTNPNFDQAAIILDAMTQASTDSVKYNYYQVMLKDRKIQDNESEKMLDLIFDNRVYDLGNVFGWGGASIYDSNSISNFMNTIAFSGSDTFVSTYESIKNTIQADLDKTIENFNKKS